jgi:hypothetical protein
VFSGNYSETVTRDLDEDTVDEDAIVEHYDYGSDSDLEDAEDLKATEKPPPLRGHPFDPLCFGSASDENDSLESNGDGTVGSNGPQDPTFPHPESNSKEGNVPGYYEEKIKEGKVIKVQDVAFVTYVHSYPCLSLPIDPRSQVPSVSLLFVHGSHRVRTLRIRGQSQNSSC